MKTIFLIPFVMLVIVGCTENKTALRTRNYYIEYLDEAEKVAQQCRKENIKERDVFNLPEEELKSKSEKAIKYENCRNTLFVDSLKGDFKAEKVRQEREKIEVDKIKKEIKTFEGKDQLYYLNHLDKAKERSEICRNDRELAINKIYFKVGSPSYEDNYELSKEESTYAQNFNLKVFKLKDCSLAIRAVETEELRQEWLKKEEEEDVSRKAHEIEVKKVKKELEKKYTDMSWQDFYRFALEQENVVFLYTDRSIKEGLVREAIEEILFDKGQERINELKSKELNTLISTLPKECKIGFWDSYPDCRFYAEVLKEKFKPLFYSNFQKANEKYNNMAYDNIVYTSYVQAMETHNIEEMKVLMSDYKKLYSIHKRCVSDLTEKINNTVIENWHDHSPRDFFESDYLCMSVNKTMEKLDLPETLYGIAKRLIYKKAYPDNP